MKTTQNNIRSAAVAVLALVAIGTAGCEYSQLPEGALEEKTIEKVSEPVIVQALPSEDYKALEAKIAEMQSVLSNPPTDTSAEEMQALLDGFTAMQSQVEALKGQLSTLAAKDDEAGDSTDDTSNQETIDRLEELGSQLRDLTDKIARQAAQGSEQPHADWDSNIMRALAGVNANIAGLAADSESQKVEAETVENCPRKFRTNDPQKVRLVVVAYENSGFQGKRATFVQDTPHIALDEDIESLKIFKGPDYVEGDRVEFYHHTNYGSSPFPLGPGEYPDLGKGKVKDAMGYTLNSARNVAKWFRSLKIIESTDTPSCDGPAGNYLWTNEIDAKIPLVVEIYQHGQHGGVSMQLIEDADNLTEYGFTDKIKVSDSISSMEVRKGPDFEEGYGVMAYKDVKFQELLGSFYVDDYGTLNRDINDEISSIKLGKPIIADVAGHLSPSNK